MKLDLSTVNIQLAEERDFDFVLDGRTGILVIEGDRGFWESEKERSEMIKGVHEDIQLKQVLIAETKDAVGKDEYVGFIGMVFSNQVPFGVNYGEMEDTLCWVSSSWVVSKYRGSGVGRYLYSAVEKHALSLGVKEVWCDVYMCNADSRAFHEKLGFEPHVLLYRKNLGQTVGAPHVHTDNTTPPPADAASTTATTEGPAAGTA